MIDEKNLLAVIKNQQEHIQESYNGKNAFVDIKEAFSLFAEIVESQSKTDKWIPCSERLPKDNPKSEYYDSLLITIKCSKGYRTVVGCYRNDCKEWYGDITDGQYSIITNDVVAWMPLPEPYKEEKK